MIKEIRALMFNRPYITEWNFDSSDGLTEAIWEVHAPVNGLTSDDWIIFGLILLALLMNDLDEIGPSQICTLWTLKCISCTSVCKNEHYLLFQMTCKAANNASRRRSFAMLEWRFTLSAADNRLYDRTRSHTIVRQKLKPLSCCVTSCCYADSCLKAVVIKLADRQPCQTVCSCCDAESAWSKQDSDLDSIFAPKMPLTAGTHSLLHGIKGKVK